MTNHSAKPPKKKFGELLDTSPYLQRAIQRNRQGLERFFRNNAHLLAEKNISVYRQLKDIAKESGFDISQSVYHGLKVGKAKVCSTAIVYVIAEYWQLDGDEMMNRDLTQPAELPKVA